MRKTLLWLMIITFALTAGCHKTNDIKAQWIKEAFETIKSGRYPAIKAVSWWNENWDNVRLRIDSSPEALEAYRSEVKDSLFITMPLFVDNKLIPADNGIYHSAFPDFGGTEDIVTQERIKDFEQLAQKKIVWAYFSNNWTDGIRFPMQAVMTIHNAGCVPFIRMMPRTSFDEYRQDSIYTMQRIINGDFDSALVRWARDAASLDFPILVEFGTEVNGSWFPWNGTYNGGGTTDQYGDPDYPDGPERFRDAYRHIIDICRQQGADNITWFFHVDAQPEPDAWWNDIKYYYPGNDYIDWVGISAYGSQSPDEEYVSLSELLDNIYPRLREIAPDKPVALLEFGITEY